MASAGVSMSTFMAQMEESILCPVCLDIYSDPQVLSCQHTVCKACLGKLLTKTNQLHCPTCRIITQSNGWKKAFKVQEIVDLFKTGCSIRSVGQGAVTDVTGAKQQVGQWKCVSDELKFFLSGRSKENLDKDMYINVDDQAACTGTAALQSEISSLKEELEQLVQQSSREEGKAYNILQQAKVELLQKVENHFKAEKTRIAAESEKHRRTVQVHYEEYLKKLERHSMVLHNTDDNPELKLEVFNIVLQQIETDVQEFSQLAIPPLKFKVKNLTRNINSFNELQAVKIKSAVNEVDRNSSENVQSSCYLSDLCVKGAKVTDYQQKTDNVIHAIQVDNTIWLMTKNTICTYNLSGERLNSNTDDIQDGRGLVYLPSKYPCIIVATGMAGLMALDKSGHILVQIDSAEYITVTHSRDNILGIRNNSGKLQICSFTQTSLKDFERVCVINTRLELDSYHWSGLAACEHMYVSSEGKHCLYQLDVTNGSTIATYGSFGTGGDPGKLYNPILSYSEGNMLMVADKNNHRLQILDTATKQWHVIKLEASGHDVRYPWAVTVLTNGALMIMGGKYPKYYRIHAQINR